MKPLLIVFEDGSRYADVIAYEELTDPKTIAQEIIEMDGKEDMTYTISHDLEDFTEKEISNITASAYEFFNHWELIDLIEKIYKLLWEKIENPNKKKNATKDLYTLLIDYLI